MDLRTKERTLAGALLVALAALALYARTAGFGYLRLDDWGYTAGCPFVVGGLTWDNVAAAFSRFRYGGVWMPLTYLSYAADVTLLGGGWGVHHAVNAALHAVNAVVVFLFILSLLPPPSHLPLENQTIKQSNNQTIRIAAALAAAMLWAVHPQRVEAVAWIASRKEELWTLFTLLGLMAWLRRRFRLGTLLYLGACLSKPTAVCFPLLALLVARRPNGRAACPQAAASRWGRRILPYVPLFLIALVTGLVAIVSQTHPEGMAPVPVAHVPFLERLVRAAVALGLSLAQMLVPWGVHFDYMDASPLVFVFGLLALGSILALLAIGRLRAGLPTNLTISQFHNQTILLFSLLFFLLSYLPVSGLFGSFGEHARADRFLYLPSVGIAGLVACVLSRAGRTARGAALALAVVYAVLAWPVVGSYRNDYTAFARALTFDPDHWRALQHVGSESCARLGRMDEGIEMLRRSYSLSPRDSTAEVLAYALACRGDRADGSEIRRLCRAAAARPVADRRGMMAEALGIAALWEGEWVRAEAYLRASLAAPERFYSDTEAKFRLAEARTGGGDAAGAKALLRPLALSDDKAVRRRALARLNELAAGDEPPVPPPRR